MTTISEILEAAQAIAAQDDRLSPIACKLLEVTPSLADAVNTANRTGRATLTIHEGHSVAVYPAGTKPTKEARNAG